MPGGEIDYQQLLHRGLLSVVREALRGVADQGLPGEHHFYLTFRTDEPGVEIPARLRRRFPEEMTVVLQHQFWNLVVEDERFQVTLRFDGAPEELSVPFCALASFADPAAQFALRFERAEEPGAEEADGESAAAESAPSPAGDVVSLDDFRKR